MIKPLKYAYFIQPPSSETSFGWRFDPSSTGLYLESKGTPIFSVDVTGEHVLDTKLGKNSATMLPRLKDFVFELREPNTLSDNPLHQNRHCLFVDRYSKGANGCLVFIPMLKGQYLALEKNAFPLFSIDIETASITTHIWLIDKKDIEEWNQGLMAINMVVCIGLPAGGTFSIFSSQELRRNPRVFACTGQNRLVCK